MTTHYSERLGAVSDERLLLWEYFTRPPQRADWTASKIFSSWGRRYVERLSALL